MKPLLRRPRTGEAIPDRSRNKWFGTATRDSGTAFTIHLFNLDGGSQDGAGVAGKRTYWGP